MANKSFFGNRWQPLLLGSINDFCKLFLAIAGSRAVISPFNRLARDASARRGCLSVPLSHSGSLAGRLCAALAAGCF